MLIQTKPNPTGTAFLWIFLCLLFSAATSAQSGSTTVTGLTLVNADTDTDIGPLNDGDTIILSALPTTNLNVRANTSPATVDKVTFDYDAITNYRSEGVAPYALEGDKNGDYNPWTPAPGPHTLSVTAELSNSTSAAYIVNFHVLTQVTTDCNNVLNGTAYLDDCGVCVGGNTGLAPNLDKDSCGVCFGDGTSCVGCNTPTVTSFSLINTTNGTDLGLLEDGDTIDQRYLLDYSIVANTCGSTTESVEFFVDGNSYNVDNGEPYAINGNTNGFFNSWSSDSGMHVITAIPYNQNNANGSIGNLLSINLLIIDTGQVDTTGFGIIPNDVCGHFPGGRIALSFDGNLHDSDDYAALPMAAAMLYYAGLQQQLVHVEYNNHLGLTDSVQEYEMRLSAKGAWKRWGYDQSIFYDAITDPDSASDALARAINQSTAQSPLWILAGGPVETIARGMAKSDSTKRKFVRIISHSNWNENHTHFGPPLYNDWQDLVDTYTSDSTALIQIPDMNGDADFMRFKGPRSLWRWLITDPDTNFHWLYARNKTSAFDVSDAGMTYWLLSGGDTTASTDELRGLFENPCPFGCTCACDSNIASQGTIVNPADSSVFASNTGILAVANVTDPDSNTAFVEFYAGGVLQGTDSTNTYSLNILGLDTGYHQIYVRAVDTCGETAYTDTITVSVQNMDCAGVPGGSAFLDSCGSCVGGTTGLLPGHALDSCGVCFGNGFTCASIDCNGDTLGTALIDSCGICAGGNTGVTPNSSCTDCNGDINGTASVDACGICAGGNTGVTPDASCTDCSGVVNGTAAIDNCGVCAGGSTGITPDASCSDCNGVVNGTAAIDDCGVCSGGITGIVPNVSCTDCNGDVNGTAFIDSCGVCASGNTGITANSQCLDCHGDVNGSAYIDDCGVCAAGNTGITANASCQDCNGDVNGTASIDTCGVCAGGNTGIVPNSSCTDCNGVLFGAAAIDSCGVCAGGNTGNVPGISCAPCVANQVVSLTLMSALNGGGPIRILTNNDVIYRSVDGPFSIRADICNLGGVSSVVFNLDGDDIQVENIAPYSINGDNANGFRSWDPGNGTFVITATPYSSNAGNGTAGIPVSLSITIDDVPPPPDCNGDPGGSASIDLCEVCSGGNTGIVPNSSCTDCTGELFGTAFIDSCGECASGNTGVVPNESCSDCAGVVNGTASIDACGVCTGGTTGLIPNASCLDCNGVPNGTAFLDECDVCAGGNTGVIPNESCTDCAGVVNGTAFIDSCGECAGGVTGIVPNSSCRDCNGDINGIAFNDNCGECAAGNTGIVPDASCTDCNGVVNGTAYLDSCGTCAGGNTGVLPNTACTDCNGVVNGTAYLDSCGICAAGSTGIVPNASCTDCAGVINGTAMIDDCGVCAGGTTGITINSTCKDCFGDVNGLALIDSCGQCTGGNTGLTPNASCTDCNGVINGQAYLDSCGVCAGGTTGIQPNSSCADCAGVPNGTASIDNCGNCAGGTTGITPDASCSDCVGIANGTAYMDSCGTCAGGNTGIVPNEACTDCAGVIHGTASIDSCGVCAGGTTGILAGQSCACSSNEVVSITIMQAGPGSVSIRKLVDNDVLYLSQLGPISLRADICDNLLVGSVVFNLNGSNIRIENLAPYAINGDRNGDFNAWNVTPGVYTLSAIPYSNGNAGGSQGIAETVTFTVFADPPLVDCNGELGGTAYIDACGQCAGGNTGITPNQACTDCNGEINGTAMLDACGVCAGGSTGVTPGSACADCAGVPNGTAYVDSCGICAGGTTGITPDNTCNTGACQPNEVTILMLIDASNATDVHSLRNNDTINLNSLPSFSVRADVCDPSAVGSVIFDLSGTEIRTENVVPYAVNGDNNGNYDPWPLGVGTYTLTATPYSSSNGGGATGTSKTVTFHVINALPAPDCHGDPGGAAYYDACGNCVGGNTGQLPCVPPADCGDFIESGGLAVIEMEATPRGAITEWYQGTGSVSGLTVPAPSGSYYMWKADCVSGNSPNYVYTGCSGTNAGADGEPLDYTISITNAGRYRLQMRSWQTGINTGGGSPSSENNDCWIQLPDGGGVKKKGNTEIQIGSSEWVKVYQNQTNTWNWATNTVDNDPHQIYIDFPFPGSYTIRIAGRSMLFALDRFVLYRSDNAVDNLSESYATSLLREASKKVVCGEGREAGSTDTRIETPGLNDLSDATGASNQSLQSGLEEVTQPMEVEVYPNPVTGILKLSIVPADLEVVVNLYDATGKLLSEDTFRGTDDPYLNMTELPSGIYWVRISHIENSKTIRVFKQ